MTQDARRIAEMSRDFVEAGLGWRWTAERVLRNIRNAATNVVVAHQAGRVSGFGIMEYKEEEAHLVLLAVDASLRRRGIGSSLVAWLEATARTAGIGLIFLEARAKNHEALAFYRKLGYKEVGIIPGYYLGLEDGVRIAKDLWSRR